MKARVKETGEIIELCNMEYDEDGNEYYRDELELIDDYEPDYWEKLKHQYAGMVIQGIFANPKFKGIDIKVAVLSAYGTAIELTKLMKEELE